MNYNAVLAKKDGSYIPIRHDFDTHIGFVQDFMREQKDAIRSGVFQIAVGDLIVDIEDISHIQPIYEEEEEKEEQGGIKGMQLFGDGFMAEGDPYELAVFAKNLQADEIHMSDCCEDDSDCCDGCDCDVESVCCDQLVDSGTPTTHLDGHIGVVCYPMSIEQIEEDNFFIFQLPEGIEFNSSNAKMIVSALEERLGNKKVVPIPYGAKLYQSF